MLFNDQISQLVLLLNEKTEFYHRIPDAHDEAKLRVGYLKHHGCTPDDQSAVKTIDSEDRSR